ncbi:MAG: DUF1175 family protein [Vicinamibacterales bacterium]
MRAVALAVLLAASTAVSAQVRLADESDRAAFRAWFVLLADAQFERPAPEITDCAGLIRFAFREALRAHTPAWTRRVQLPPNHPRFPDVRSAPEADDGHWPLFRVAGPPDTAYGEFADAQTLIRLNTRPRGRRLDALAPGDLLYFHQPGQSEPDHLMVFVGRSSFDPGPDDWVVYHTGPAEDGPGEIRKVRLADLLRHPAPRWRPQASNPHFVGVFRLALL